MSRSWSAQYLIRQTCVGLCAGLLLTTLAWGQLDLERMHALALARYSADTAEVVDQWYATIERMRAMDETAKLTAANDFFNRRIRWAQDPEAWNAKDYWATPLETMGRGMGDCEDFAIAKYTMLVLAGVDVDKLRITYVKARGEEADRAGSSAHMVLAYYPSPLAVPAILDNLVRDIRPASERTDLTPVYGFNSRGLWVGGATAPTSTEPAARLSRWRELLQRAAAEGMG